MGSTRLINRQFTKSFKVTSHSKCGYCEETKYFTIAIYLTPILVFFKKYRNNIVSTRSNVQNRVEPPVVTTSRKRGTTSPQRGQVKSLHLEPLVTLVSGHLS